MFDSVKDTAVSYSKIKASEEHKPKGEMSLSVALGRAKVEEKRRREGERAEGIRQTGERGEKRMRVEKKTRD